ncbi:MAG: M48 family metallopeptidase [Bacteroidaceae bacterium]|nr:M48 family metallopeptidase [Bacteroidaceae bacterium]
MLFAKGFTKIKDKTEVIKKSARASKILSQEKETPLPYAYPCDNYINSILSNRLVRKTLQLVADKYCEKQIENIKSTGLLVCDEKYPRFYDILQNCCRTLNIKEVPEVYITSKLKGINALSVGTDKTPIILISHKAVVGLSDNELKFMIGHELGHILQKNLICHTVKGLLDNLNNKSDILGRIVSDLIDVPLKEWYRCAEHTADRAGLICCKDFESVHSLMIKIANTERSSMAPALMELYKEHPYIQTRINVLKCYKLYYQ